MGLSNLDHMIIDHATIFVYILERKDLRRIHSLLVINMSNNKTYKDAFALFDKKGTGKIPVEHLGDLLRAVGQNPTLAEISELQSTIKAPEFDFETYEKIINRPDGFKPLGLPEDYIKGFQVFDKEQTGYIGVGELRYILTSIGEKLTDAEVDELLKGVNVTAEGNVDYVEFVKSILDQ
ncbi:hypothetical protein CAJCM15448_20270 [Candidozyma auris]|nr:hypothetical protein CAJCM15448_20270 [[Candida] auris]